MVVRPDLCGGSGRHHIAELDAHVVEDADQARDVDAAEAKAKKRQSAVGIEQATGEQELLADQDGG